MKTYYSSKPDLGQHAWHEEDGFLHGYINGVYYRMVCTPEELEEVRARESLEQERTLDNDEVWWLLDAHHYVDPWDASYGPFEPASPFKDDLDFESRRRIIALKMYIDPDTTSWYSLRKQYEFLMKYRRAERRKVLQQRILALGLDPKLGQDPETLRCRFLVFELGLKDLFHATWNEISNAKLELHKVALPCPLVRRVRIHLKDKIMNADNFLKNYKIIIL